MRPSPGTTKSSNRGLSPLGLEENREIDFPVTGGGEMTDATLTTQTTVTIGWIQFDGFIRSGGSYWMNESQVAAWVGLSTRNLRNFLRSKALKSFLGEDYTPATFKIKPTPGQIRGRSPIRILPLEAVQAYWLWQTYKGNKKALVLCLGPIAKSLEHRFDEAFGLTHSPIANRCPKIQGFKRSDGTLLMSQTQAAEHVGKSERNVRDFLRSKASKFLLGGNYTPAIFAIEPDGGQTRGRSRIRALPLEIVRAYWLWQTYKGNKKALALCAGFIDKPLECCLEPAFEVAQTNGSQVADATRVKRTTAAAQIVKEKGTGMDLDKTLIFKALWESPPLFILDEKCHTADTQKIWRTLRFHSQLIALETRSIWEGEPSQTNKYCDEKFLLEQAKVLAKIYAVLEKGLREKWSSIATKLIRLDNENADLKIQVGYLQSPGHLLGMAIREQHTIEIEPYLSYSEISPSRIKESIRNKETYEKITAQHQITEEDKKTLKYLEKRNRKIRSLMGFKKSQNLKSACVKILEEEYNNDPTENPYKIYKKLMGELKAIKLKHLHPRETPRGIRFKDGVCLDLC